MDRSRRAGFTALILIGLVVASGAWISPGARAASVAWPPSTLLISEIQTGGTSASDEFVEIANQGNAPIDLIGLEVVYVTSSGSTVTRKATWATSISLDPGRRTLLANAAGLYGPIADATYSGGFAATGGALALRVVGGAVLDAVGWGDASNGFVEGAPALAPAAGSSLERAPGGSLGNGSDTNDNSADWFVQGAPSPQGLDAPAVPGALPSPSTTPIATATPTAAPTPLPTPMPTPSPTPAPVATPTPPSTPAPTSVPALTPIGTARALADGTVVSIAGVLTTALGAVESGQGGFVQDGTGGIAVYLDATVVGAWPAGTSVTLTGAVSSRYGQRTVKTAEASVTAGMQEALPDAADLATGDIDESHEGTRIQTRGKVIGGADSLADGLAVDVDDGSGPVRVVVGPDALQDMVLGSGLSVVVAGPLGQRDSSGTGTAGYRIHATLPGDLTIIAPDPTPVPTPPVPTPVPTPPVPTPVPTPPVPTPSPTVSPSPGPLTVIDARSYPVGSIVHTMGVVVAEAGRMGAPTLLAIGSDDAGLVVHLPAGLAGYPRGTVLDLTGRLAAPYGQLEIRPANADVRSVGSDRLPTALSLPGGGLDESLEGRYLTATGRLTGRPKSSSGGDLTLLFERDGTPTFKVMADVSSRVDAASLQVGATYRILGVAGQRASRSGALDGYRIWIRDASDLVLVSGPDPSATPSASPGSPGSSSSARAPITIARALKIDDREVTVVGVVTAPATLLDSTGRRIVIQDASAAVEVLVPTGVKAPAVGARVRADGKIGVAYGAPRFRADQIVVVGSAPAPKAVVLHAGPREVDEWRLVTVTGRVTSMSKLGDRWRAELRVGTAAVVVVGQPGAGIASGSLTEGRTASITGIVRRPYPTATDRRFAVTPRFPADVHLGAAPAGQGGSNTVAGTGTGAGPSASADPTVPEPMDADLIDLDAATGTLVRVGGLVDALFSDGFSLDDGTAIGRVVLRGAVLERLMLVEPGDALNATGRVELTASGPVVVVADAGGLAQAGDPVAALPTPVPSARAFELAGIAWSSAPTAAQPPRATPSPRRDGPFPPGAGIAGAIALLAIAGVSLVGSTVRQRQVRRRSSARIEARLATFAGRPAVPSAASLDPRTAERGSSTIHSA